MKNYTKEVIVDYNYEDLLNENKSTLAMEIIRLQDDYKQLLKDYLFELAKNKKEGESNKDE